MRSALRWFAVAAMVACAARVHAGGYEFDEQSPRGTATVGAQTATAADPSTLYYNPAGLAWQKGLTALGGVHFMLSTFDVKTAGVTNDGSGTRLAPFLYVAQRIDSHFAVGIGVFSNFVEELDYASGWSGAPTATQFSLATTTINPTVSIRPIPQVAIGFGLDIVPSEVTWAHTNPAVSGGQTYTDMSGVGFGGNVGVQVIAIPRYLQLGASYRSAIDLDLSGIGSLTGGMTADSNTSSTFPLPHNFAFGVASRPLEKLTLSFDARVTLWSALSTLTVGYLDPRANPDTTLPKLDSAQLNMRDSYAFRLGGEYRPTDYFWLALGIGYDRTPVRRGWLTPLTPDDDRVLVGFGMGGSYKWLDIGAAYSAQIITSRTSTNPIPPMATYDGVRHIITLGVGVHFPRLLAKKIKPKYEN